MTGFCSIASGVIPVPIIVLPLVSPSYDWLRCYSIQVAIDTTVTSVVVQQAQMKGLPK